MLWSIKIIWIFWAKSFAISFKITLHRTKFSTFLTKWPWNSQAQFKWSSWPGLNSPLVNLVPRVRWPDPGVNIPTACFHSYQKRRMRKINSQRGIWPLTFNLCDLIHFFNGQCLKCPHSPVKPFKIALAYEYDNFVLVVHGLKVASIF